MAVEGQQQPRKGAVAGGPLVPAHRGRNPSLEILVPDHDSDERQSPIIVAISNIICTVMGGGTLSLPYALSKSGYVVGILLLILSALASDFTLYVLCSCARRTGTRSFQEIARFCYGPRAQNFMMVLLSVFLVFCITAYMILLQHTNSAVLECFLGHSLSHKQHQMVLLVSIIICLPLCLRRSLHALRHVCYLGFFSVFILTLSILYRSATSIIQHPEKLKAVKAFPDSFGDVLLSLPMYILAFMCTFNILPVHSSLVDPTRARIQTVINSSMLVTWCIYVVISLSGYFYALDETKDDILSNFRSDDSLLVWGRVGLACTLFFSIPILTLPCREVTIELVDKFHRFFLKKVLGRGGSSRVASALPTSEKTPLLTLSTAYEYPPPHSSSPSPPQPSGSDTPSGSQVHHHNQVKLVVVTLLILGGAYYFAVSVPGVSLVWALAGSSLGIFIGFTLPTTFYLKVRETKARMTVLKVVSWAILVISVVGMVLCTYQAVDTYIL